MQWDQANLSISRLLVRKLHMGGLGSTRYKDWWWEHKDASWMLAQSAAAVHESAVVLKVKLINQSIPMKSVL